VTIEPLAQKRNSRTSVVGLNGPWSIKHQTSFAEKMFFGAVSLGQQTDAPDRLDLQRLLVVLQEMTDVAVGPCAWTQSVAPCNIQFVSNKKKVNLITCFAIYIIEHGNTHI
jgi:acetaldehyde dehydrogenase (acetylating)